MVTSNNRKITNPYKKTKRSSPTTTDDEPKFLVMENKNPRFSIGSKVPVTDYASFIPPSKDETAVPKTIPETTTSSDTIAKNSLDYQNKKMRKSSLFSKGEWENALKDHFGYNKFRNEQYEVLNALIHQGRNVAVFWSTGSGKSLCYQLPPLFLSSNSSDAAALIISPLISLMQDQVAKINGKFDSDDCIAIELSSSNSNTTTNVKNVLETYKLIYCTPETFSSVILPQLSSTVKERLCLVAIDECHCVSEWGHDFRPEYQRIGEILQINLPNVPKLALTATAVPYVQKDILQNLYFDETNTYVSQQSFDRHNLRIHVQRKRPGGYRANLLPLLSSNQQANNKNEKNKNNYFPSTIIYCPTRNLVDQITAWLQTEFHDQPHVTVQSYHAGMTNDQRMDAHFQFLVGKTQIIVATIAFGMGIDKPDVRQVIHYGPPKTLEAYYQQIGRAGRDGYTSKCIMFCDESDFASYQSDFYIGKLQGMAKEMTTRSIQALRDFAMNQDQCRRVSLLKFFEETPSYQRCGTCDTCQNRQQYQNDLERDFGPSGARLILYALSVLKQRIAITVIMTVLSGKTVESYRYKNYVNVQGTQGKIESMKSEFTGKVKKNKEYFKELLNALVERGYVSCDSQRSQAGGNNFSRTYAVYSLTQKGCSALNDNSVPIMLTTPVSVREMERIEEEKLQVTISNLQKAGVDIQQIPKHELENGDGDVLKALRTWYNYIDTFQKNERFDKVDQMDELYSCIDAWRMDMAIQYKMSPVAVMPDHLLVKVAYAAATLRGNQTLNKDALIAAGVRSGGIEILISAITEWTNKYKDETLSVLKSKSVEEQMVFPDLPFKPQRPWEFAVYKPHKKTGLAAWESSYNRFQDGENPQTIAMSPANGRPIQVTTVIGHILDGLVLGRPVNLSKLAQFSDAIPPTRDEWEALLQAEKDTGMNVTGDPDTSGANGDKFKMSDFLCPILGNVFFAKDYNDRTDEEKAMYSKWCGLLKWYMTLRRVGFEPTFEFAVQSE